MRVLVPILVLAAVATSVLFWSQRQRGQNHVSGTIEADEIRVGSRVGGRIQEVLAEEGQFVRAGDVLIRLEPHDLRERLAQARATLAANKANLARLQAGVRPEEIEQAVALRDRYQAILNRLLAGSRPLELKILNDKVDFAQAELRDAQREFVRVKALGEQGQAIQFELESKRDLLAAAEARANQSADELSLAKEGPRAEEIAEARANLAGAEAALGMQRAGYRKEEIEQASATVGAATEAVAIVERQIQELEVKSPGECFVDAVNLHPGDLVIAGAPILTLLNMSDLWVRAYVPEDRLGLKIGARISMRVDAYPGREFQGRLVFIARQAEFTPSNAQTSEERVKQVFRVKVALEDSGNDLRPGMPADVYLPPRP